MSLPAIRIQNLSVGYQSRKHLRAVASDVDAALYPGELVCLLGPNGAGKSTLIRTLSGILEPLAGAVELHGKSLHSYSSHELARHLGLVLTQKVAAGMLQVEKLVALGRYPYTDWSGRLSHEDRKVVSDAIRAVGIEHLAERAFNELSDGEQQKVMIARALAQEPKVLILDEPTAFLDLPHRVELMHILSRLAHEKHCAILMSTHELDLALQRADRLWLLPAGGPMIEGAPEDLVLEGALAATFAGISDKVQFDVASGSFRAHLLPQGIVGIKGRGVAREWTERALERAGYEVVQDFGISPCVEVVEQEGERFWWLRDEESICCDSLHAVLQCLRQRQVTHQQQK